MKMKVTVFALSLLISTPAFAIEPMDAAYYCTTEASGGLRYDEQIKKWRSASFRNDENFILKFKFVSTTSEPLYKGGQPEKVHRFKISITKAGNNTELPCSNFRDDTGLVAIWSSGSLHCSHPLHPDFQFNPNNNRFLSAYLHGYISGKDNNDDTPSISAGVCTKVN